MRRIGRRSETYCCTQAAKEPMSENWAERVWMTTQLRARAWAKAHGGNRMGALQWNALWERTRDEIYGTRWASEESRSHARREVLG